MRVQPRCPIRKFALSRACCLGHEPGEWQLGLGRGQLSVRSLAQPLCPAMDRAEYSRASFRGNGRVGSQAEFQRAFTDERQDNSAAVSPERIGATGAAGNAEAALASALCV